MKSGFFLSNGNPFDSDYPAPLAVVPALALGRMEFRRGPTSRLNRNYDIAEEDAHKVLVEALELVWNAHAEWCVTDGDDFVLQSDLRDSSGLRLRIGDDFLQMLWLVEDEDRVFLHKMSNGLWMDAHQFMGALMIFQIDRAITGIREARAEEVAALMWDVHGMVLQIEHNDTGELLNHVEQKPKLQASKNGKTGAEVRHRRTRELKTWALDQAQSMRGQDIDIAKRLSLQIPSHLVNACKNPERLIYEALLQRTRARRPNG